MGVEKRNARTTEEQDVIVVFYTDAATRRDEFRFERYDSELTFVEHVEKEDGKWKKTDRLPSEQVVQTLMTDGRFTKVETRDNTLAEIIYEERA